MLAPSSSLRLSGFPRASHAAREAVFSVEAPPAQVHSMRFFGLRLAETVDHQSFPGCAAFGFGRASRVTGLRASLLLRSCVRQRAVLSLRRLQQCTACLGMAFTAALCSCAPNPMLVRTRCARRTTLRYAASTPPASWQGLAHSILLGLDLTAVAFVRGWS